MQAFTADHMMAAALRLPMATPNRDVTVLFAHMPPNSAETTLTDILAAAARFGAARVTETPTGIVAIFTTGQNEQDHALRAVMTGLAIRDRTLDRAQQSKVGVDIRIGIHTGLAMLGTERSQRDARFAALEELVAAADAIGRAFPAGSAIISDRTRRLVGNEVRWRSCGAVRTPTDRLAVFHIDGLARDLSGIGSLARRFQSPLEGREEEIALLTRFLGQASRGEGPALALTGASGLGKSRLGFEASLLAARQGLAVELLSGLPGRSHEPFYALRALLLRHFGARLQDDETMMATAMGKLGLCERDMKALAAITLGPRGQSLWQDLPAPRRGAIAREAFSHFLLALARGCGLLLIVDDLHLVDAETRYCLVDLLTCQHADRPAVLVTSQAMLDPDLSDLAVARHDLSGLAPAAGERLALHQLGTVQPADHRRQVAATIAQKSKGSPLLIEEMIALIASQRPEVDPDTLARLPEGTEAIFAARLDHLGEAARLLAIAASAFGEPTTPAQLKAISALPDQAFADATGELIESQVLRLNGDQTLAFNHHQFAEACHTRMTDAVSHMIHARIHDALDTGQPVQAGHVTLARHAEAAGRMSQAIGHLRRACKAAAQTACPTSHAHLHGWVLSLLRADDLRDDAVYVETVLAACRIYFPLGRLGDLTADLRTAAAICETSGNQAGAAEARTGLALAALLGGAHREALRLARQAQSIASPGGGAVEGLVLSICEFLAGQIEAGLQRASAIAAEAGPLQPAALGLLAWFHAEAGSGAGAPGLNAPIAATDMSDAALQDLLLAGAEAHTSSRAGQPEAAAAKLSALLAVLRRTACHALEPLLTAWAADALIDAGRPATAIEACRTTLEAPFAEGLSGHGASLLRIQLSRALLDRGETNAALFWIDEALRIARQSGDPLAYADANMVRARLRKATGDPDWTRNARLSARLARRISAGRILQQAKVLLNDA